MSTIACCPGAALDLAQRTATDFAGRQTRTRQILQFLEGAAFPPVRGVTRFGFCDVVHGLGPKGWRWLYLTEIGPESEHRRGSDYGSLSLMLRW
ncbi:MAG TPA: hypothetical protein VK192_02800 [Sphingomicrobium sp.]|nr:hypothetical protein [Sphingomicrobium sp.]